MKDDDPAYTAARKRPEISNYPSGRKKGLEGDSERFEGSDDFEEDFDFVDGDIIVDPVSQPRSKIPGKKIKIKVDK